MDLKILVVDDEKDHIDNMCRFFQNYNLTGYSDPRKALKELSENYYDIVIVDYKMPELSGLDLLIQAKSVNAYSYGVLFTAYAEKNILQEAINNNLVSQIIEKPVRLSNLKEILDEIIESVKIERNHKEEIYLLKARYSALLEEMQLPKKIIGVDKGLKLVFKNVLDISDLPVSVLLTGETGTGKEMIANAIHCMSKRRNGPFIKVNCSAIPENLFESELFGVEKGAFADAKDNKPGKIELADNGTLFLDEIGEIKPDLQAKLLRVLQEKAVMRLGANKPQKIDFRLICATNKTLNKSIKEKQFQQDLFYRINEYPIHIPTLSERKEDIHELVAYFVLMTCKELNLPEPNIADDTISYLQQYSWPGNIRELENAVRRVLIRERKITEIQPFHFRFLHMHDNPDNNKKISQHTKPNIEITAENTLFIRNNFPTLKVITKLLISEALRRTNNNQSKAAALLGISHQALSKRLKRQTVAGDGTDNGIYNN